MRFSISNFRWPFREDRLFSLLAFLTLVVPLAFSFKTYENFEMIKFSLWLLLLGWALMEYWRQKGQSRVSEDGKQSISRIQTVKGSRWIFGILGSLVLWSVLSTIFSVDWLNSTFGFYYRFTSGLLFYGTWILFLLLILQTLDKERFAFLAKILVFDGFIVALWAFLNSMGIGYYESLDSAGFLRAPSLLGNPNFSTMFLVCVLPFAAVLGFKSDRLGGKVYYFIAAALMVLANLALASRGALLGLVAGLLTGAVLLLWHRFRAKYFGIILAVIGLCLALGIVFVQISRPSALKQETYSMDQNVSLRLLVWKASLRGMVDRPLLGVGPGNFQIFFEQYRDRNSLDQKVYIFDDAHNLFLQMAATTGVPFVLSFFALLVLAFGTGIRQFRKNGDSFALAGLSSLVAFAVAGSFTPVSIPNFVVLGVVLAGLIMGTGREYGFSWNNKVKTVGLALGIVLAIFGLCLVTAEYLFAFGRQAFFQGNYQRSLTLTQAALTINPSNAIYYIYRTGSEIGLGKDPELIERHINQVKDMHPAQSRSLVSVSNLYSFWHQHTGQAEYLQKAVSELQASLSLDSRTAERYAQLGLYYYQLGEPDAAKEYLLRALEMKNDHFPSWLLMAKINQQQGNRVQFLSALEEAYKLIPNNLRLRAILQFAKMEPDMKKVPLEISVAAGPLE